MISQNANQDIRINTQYTNIAPLNEKHGVFLVRDEFANRMCVKKNLKTYNADVYKRIKEARTTGLPEIYHMQEDDGELTVYEEYISGETVDSMLKNKGAMSEEQVRDISLKLCDILIELHSMAPPVIHRDIKPSNVMVTPIGEVKLLDLNAAKLEAADKSEDTVLLGTYGYAAPEQYGFGSSTIQTDIYALGMLMNTMLQGEFSKDIAKDSILSGIIEKCVMMRPEERYRSASELRTALNHPNKKNINFIPPGFRTKNPIHMLTAVLGYAAIGSVCLGLETRTQVRYPSVIWYERIVSMLIMLTMVLFAADYLGVQKRLPLCRSNNVIIKIIGIILFEAIISALLLFIMIGIEAIVLIPS